MINQNVRSPDAEDIEVLFHAILRYAEANTARLNRTVIAVGYANLMELAKRAAEQVALLHDDEGDEWDGDLWGERLADFSEDSLAAVLFATDNPVVPVVVVKWLLSFGYVELTHNGKRWAFDSDELAEWEEGDEEGFHFRVNHELADPTVETMSRFIDQL